MRYLSFILCMLFLCCCHKSTSNKNQIPNYEGHPEKITAVVAQKINQETGLRLIGTGGGTTDNHLWNLSMSFAHYGGVTMEEGRELLVYCVNEYLAEINANEGLRPHMLYHPFTPKNLEIVVFVRGLQNEDVSIGEFSVIAMVNGTVRYQIEQPFPIIMKEVHKETYEEAVKILEAQDPTMELIMKNKKQNHTANK